LSPLLKISGAAANVHMNQDKKIFLTTVYNHFWNIASPY